MSEMLPIGEEAAAARLRLATSYIGYFERELPTPATGRLADALEIVRADPLDPTAWAGLAAEVRTQIDVPPRPWNTPSDWAEQARHIVIRMNDVAEADAPICDTHGPMTSKPDAGAPNGTLWFCAGAARCRAGYLWFDGTYFPAPTRRPS